jgi:DNA-binding response OmpR family regulator
VPVQDKPREKAKEQILIVEDDIDLAEMLNAYFRVQGFDVLTAAWGEDALRLAQDAQPDVVVLDIRLPDIDGYEVCRRLRAHRRTETIPIIFLTDRRERADKLAGLELGAVDYITKPFDIQELRLRIRNALNRSRQESLTNPITGLPEGALVDERLSTALAEPGWAVLAASITGLEHFRETYGFVAGDDVVRAASLMIANATREAGGADDFVGQVGPTDFLIVTGEARAPAVRDRLVARLAPSIQYFYPARDRERVARDAGQSRLGLAVGLLTASTASVADVEELKRAVLRARVAA